MNSKIKLLIVLLLAFNIFFTGCTKKDKPVNQPDTTKQVSTDTSKHSQDSSKTKDTTKTDSVEVKKTVSLLGTWQGKVANYNATLKVTNQNGNQFSGSVVVNYRNVATHNVTGTFNPENGAINMADTDQTRSAGVYAGMVSPNGRSISGNFTEKLKGGITVKFSFNK